MERSEERTEKTVYGIRDNLTFRIAEDTKELEYICKRSGSKRVKSTCSYLSVAKWQAKEKFFAEILNDFGFFAGTFNKHHFNLIDLAVLEEEHGNGYGTILVRRMKKRCREKDIHLIKLRTSMGETAVDFWQKQGAEITGYKEDDFTMEIRI